MHRGTRDRLAAYTDLWAEQGVVAWETWAPHVVAVADLVGSIVGAPPGTTVMRQNVADLLGDVVSALDWRGERNRVVTDALDWPGSLHTFSQLHRLGGEAVVVPGDPTASRSTCSAARRRRRAHRLVYVSHVLFRTSTVVDVAAVVQRAHEVGALAWSTATRQPGPSRSTSSRSTSTSTWAGR
jgi:kynureninase